MNYKCIIYDFDGVMTNNSAIVNEDGFESVTVSRSDGWGIRQLKLLGAKQMILSTERNKVVETRAKKLEIEVISGSEDKCSDLNKYCKSYNISLDKVLYVGNDLNDLDVMKSNV